MTDLERAVMIALAFIGGIAVCIGFATFCINLSELFERVSDLEKMARMDEEQKRRLRDG